MSYLSIADKIKSQNGHLYKNNLFNFDILFNQMKNNTLDIGLQINTVPFLKDMAIAYENLLDYYYQKDCNTIIKAVNSGDYFFEKKILIQDNYLKLIVNITKLQSKIKTTHFPSIRVPIEDLLLFSEKAELTDEGKKRAKTNLEKPFLLCTPFISSKYTVIDGNHRVYHNNLIGKKEMEVLLLSITNIDDCYPSTFNKLLTYIIFNIYFYFSYILDFISLEELESTLIPLICEKY